MDEATLRQALRQHFGFTKFKAGQSEVLLALFAHHDTLGILPTGTGKSLCYQLYGLMVGKPVVIISPLISLMQDQVQQLQHQGFKRSVALTALERGQRAALLANLAAYQFIFLAPEMLANPQVLACLEQLDIGLLVVDEAHCISTWGFDFRLQYTQLAALKAQLNPPVTLALTATADERVQTDIINKLQLNAGYQVIRYSVNRPNIFLERNDYPNEQSKRQALVKLVPRLAGCGIIYCSSKKTTMELCQQLQANSGLRVAYYHAALPQEQRNMIQQQFLADELDVLCATTAFGMGINKPNVRYVIHYHMPADVAAYLQEIGRAGRDGKPALAILLTAPTDVLFQKRLQQANLPDDNTLGRLLAKWHHRPPKEVDEHAELVWQLFQQKKSQQEIEQYITARRQVKINQVNQMAGYLHEQHCLRGFLLQAFGEAVPPHTANCCAINQPVPPQFIRSVPLTQPHPTKLQPAAVVWHKLFAGDLGKFNH